MEREGWLGRVLDLRIEILGGLFGSAVVNVQIGVRVIFLRRLRFLPLNVLAAMNPGEALFVERRSTPCVRECTMHDRTPVRTARRNCMDSSPKPGDRHSHYLDRMCDLQVPMCHPNTCRQGQHQSHGGLPKCAFPTIFRPLIITNRGYFELFKIYD